MNWQTLLPAPLAPFAEAIAATAQPCVRLHLHPSPPPHIRSSKLGGDFYWPINREWPTDDTGRPLFGLLQLDLAELPALPALPADGILQVFVADGGRAFASYSPQTSQLVYHPPADPANDLLLTDFSFLPHFTDLPLTAGRSLTVTGTPDSMPMPPEDHRFDATLGGYFVALGDERWEVLAAYRRAIGTVGHRLGGYAGFVQDDPRPPEADWELLLQLDSEPQLGLIWGDLGVAHWFARRPGVDTRSLDTPAAGDLPWDEVWGGCQMG